MVLFHAPWLWIPGGPGGPVGPVAPAGPAEPAGPAGTVVPGRPVGPMARLGSRVTLRSLLPATTTKGRESGFHPELGMETNTVCMPTATLILMGVTLPVSTPSTETFAPDGNDVTFKAPFEESARRATGTPSKNSATAIAVHPRIRVRIPHPPESAAGALRMNG